MKKKEKQTTREKSKKLVLKTVLVSSFICLIVFLLSDKPTNLIDDDYERHCYLHQLEDACVWGCEEGFREIASDDDVVGIDDFNINDCKILCKTGWNP